MHQRRVTVDLDAEREELLARLAEAERALKESREENDIHFELAGVGRADALVETGRLIRVNKAFCQIMGYAAEELQSLTVRDISHPEDANLFFQAYPRILSGELEAYAAEKRYIHKDGRIIWVSIHASLLPARTGRPAVVTGVIEDITAQKLAEAEANESATRFRGVFEHSLDAIAVYKGVYHFMVNPAYLRLFRYESQEEVLAVPGPDLIAPGERAMVADRIERRMRGEEVPGSYVTRGLRKDGTEFDLEIHASHFDVNDERFRLVILRDVTETIRAQEEKRKAHEELERRVAERTADLLLSNARLQSESLKRKRLELAMWDAIDREQKRIGEDLHDSLGQQLAGISCSVKAIKAPDDPALAASLDRIARLLSDAVAQTRRIAHGLYPPELDNGLFFALSYLSGEVTHSYGVKCNFLPAETFPIKESSGRQLYRIAQEAISNSLKHGHANLIDIELARSRDIVRLTIRDNGTGLPAPGSLRPGMGLKTMRNRARVLGGSIVLKRDAGGRTVVRCWYREEAH